MAEPKTHWVGLRTTKRIFDLARQICDEDGVNQAELLRRLLFAEGEKRGLWPPQAQKEQASNGKPNHVV